MLDKYNFNVGVWYMTKNYLDLYRIERHNKRWEIVSYADWVCHHSTETLKEAMDYMDEHCISHVNIEKELRKYGK